MTPVEEGVLRTVLALAVLEAPPTLPDLFRQYAGGSGVTLAEVASAAVSLMAQGKIVMRRGRYLPKRLEDELTPVLLGEEWMPRKLRKARRVARWLACLGGVRAVALCNRTAFGVPHDAGDLDFLVIVRHGTIWQTRLLAGLPFVVLGDRPKLGKAQCDVVCLSFFISDQALNLQDCALTPDDVYLRHWLLGLLPLVDDGVLRDFWQVNETLRAHHPLANEWQVAPPLEVRHPRVRVPSSSFVERVARRVQSSYFPASIKTLANKDTRVMISDERLKFHVDDGRERVRTRYQALCADYDIAP